MAERGREDDHCAPALPKEPDRIRHVSRHRARVIEDDVEYSVASQVHGRLHGASRGDCPNVGHRAHMVCQGPAHPGMAIHPQQCEWSAPLLIASQLLLCAGSPS